EIIETVLADPNVDCGLISIVPETAMLQTLDHHNENFASEQGIGTLLVDIRKKCTKPVVVCVESGELYAPFVHFLEKHSIPAFRSVDTAVYVLGQYMQYRIKTMNLSK
ncbi:hypothetical protein AMJ80_04560, partial [bacterium SM23_31]